MALQMEIFKMDSLRLIAFFTIIYLFLINRCMNYFFPKNVMNNFDDSLLTFFEKKFRTLQKVTLFILIIFPVLYGVLFKFISRELREPTIIIGVIIALTTSFFFVEFKSYVTAIEREKDERSQ